MGRVAAIASAVLADAVRRKVVWIVVLFSGLLAFVIPSLPSYGFGVVEAVYREVTIALMFVAAVSVALAFGATRIPGETERRTVYGVLSRDVTRGQYLAGTWAGMFAVVGVVVVAFTVVSVAVGAFVYKAFMWQLFEASFAVWLEAGVALACAVLLSSRYGSVTTAVGCVTFLFAGHSVGTLFGGEAPPWWLPSLDAFNVINPVAHGSGYGPLYALTMLAVFAAWTGLLLLGAVSLFGGRDL